MLTIIPAYISKLSHFQVNDDWNQWKTVGKPSATTKPGQRPLCCIVPPQGRVENIGVEGTYFDIDIAPVPTEPQNVT